MFGSYFNNMSNRELRGLQTELTPRTGLRSNPGRGVGILNSTSRGQFNASTTDLSSIRNLIPDLDGSFIPSNSRNTSSYETSRDSDEIQTTHERKTSEDEFSDPDVVKSEFREVEKERNIFFSMDSIEGWEQRIDEKYAIADHLATNYMRKLTLANDNSDVHNEYLKKINTLRSELQNKKKELWKQAREKSRRSTSLPPRKKSIPEEEQTSTPRPRSSTISSGKTIIEASPRDEEVFEEAAGEQLPELTYLFEGFFLEDSDKREKIAAFDKRIQEISSMLESHSERLSKIEAVEKTQKDIKTKMDTLMKTTEKNSKNVEELTSRIVGLEKRNEERNESDKVQTQEIKSILADVDLLKKDCTENASNVAETYSKAVIAETMVSGLTETIRRNKKNIESINITLANKQSITETRPLRSTTNSGTQNETSSGESARILEKRLKSLAERIKNTIKVDVSNATPELLLSDMRTHDVQEVKKDLHEAYMVLGKYSNQEICNVDTCSEAEAIFDEAEAWVKEISNIYRSREVYTMKASKNISIEISTFVPEGKQTVYEFLNDFEKKYRGTASEEQKADLLWRHHLSQKVKNEMDHIKNNLSEMKRMMITNYGDLGSCIDGVLREIESKPPPNHEDLRATSDHLTKMVSALQKIQKLKDEETISSVKWEMVVWEMQFMKRMTKLLHPVIEIEYKRALKAVNVNPRKIEGKNAFNELISFCLEQAELFSTAADRMTSSDGNNKNKKIPKASCAVVQENEEQEISGQETENRRNVYHSVNNVSTAPPKGAWYDKKHTHPCPLYDHKHEIGTCQVFLSLSPVEKRRLSSGRICWTCFRPRDLCKRECDKGDINVPCAAMNKMDKRLICKECYEYNSSKQKPLAPFNIFICAMRMHRKPPISEIEDAVKKWLPGFRVENMTGSKPSMTSANSVHVTAKTHSKTTFTRPVESNPEPIAFDTHSGQRFEPRTENIVKESSKPPCYIMQWIKCGSNNVLCFFDSGANTNIISGKIAEEEKLEVISQAATSLSIVGGGRIDTNYGTYRLLLDKCDEKVAELTCQGMGKITSEFPKHDLTEVKKELLSGQYPIDNNELLPDYVGGSDVHLLVGLREPAIHPVLLCTLQSGLGVYRSPFKDIFGSTICFGGPHPSFSATEPTSGAVTGNFCAFLSAFTTSMNELNVENFEDVKQIEPIIREGKSADIITETTPLTELTVHELLHHGDHGVDHEHDELHGDVPELHDLQDEDEPEEYDYDDGDQEPASKVERNELAVRKVVVITNKKSEQEINSVHKATIPLARVRESTIRIEDEMKEVEKDDVPNYRCDMCKNCERCRKSTKSKALSRQERIEQEAIEQSVTIDYETRTARVSLPFMKDPNEHLRKIFSGDDNMEMAEKVLRQQCKKPLEAKSAMKKVFQDMLEKGYFKKLSEFTEEEAEKITKAPVRQFMPWRIVEKPDSTSTPVRMVVDPTMTGLNSILAKGENRIGRVNEIIMRYRTHKEAWSSDISKMYNTLVLNEDAYPFSLFLWKDDLNEDAETEIYVMVVAWYGVASTGGQAGWVIELLVHQSDAEIFDLVRKVLIDGRYVDDLVSGSKEKEERDRQIQQVQELLAKAGFKLKYYVKSGEKPPPDSTQDGETIKILGYTWQPEEDLFKPGFGEINFNRKIRGAKKPNKIPINTVADLRCILEPMKLTKRTIAAKVAELYDPCGIWEPLKLQMKLDFVVFNGRPWDDKLSTEERKMWTENLERFLEIPTLQVKRCVIPEDAENLDIRLVCISDAAEKAGGTAVYASYRRRNGEYSAQLLTARSRILNTTIPRNELSAILMMAETALIAKNSLGDQVQEVVYITDSTIALCWVMNANKRLKTYVHNRVETIRYLMEWTELTNGELPLYHVNGNRNIADLLTKKHPFDIRIVDEKSEWQNGSDWMKLPVAEMPLTGYDELCISMTDATEVSKECVEQPFNLVRKEETVKRVEQRADVINIVNVLLMDYPPKSNDYTATETVCSVSNKYTNEEFLVDLVTLGWNKSCRVLSNVLKFVEKVKHNVHKKRNFIDKHCFYCNQGNVVEHLYLEKRAESYLFFTESKFLKKEYTESKLSEFKYIDGCYYFSGRLDEAATFVQRDLDISIFFDSADFLTFIPVVRPTSPIFFAFLMEVHFNLKPHAGVEFTTKHIMQKMFPLGRFRHIIKEVRTKCAKCRLMCKKTCQLQMAKQHFSRLMITPVFYHCMIDIAYGFRTATFLKSRKCFKGYAVVFVCLLTSATNILFLEAVDTQNVLLAIERHSARFGVPAEIFCDAGTQLVALKHTSFSIRDLNAQIFDSLKIKISVSNPKAHNERGRVENKIKNLRSLLEKTGTDTTFSLTAIQWETRFAVISNMIDEIPIAKGRQTSAGDFANDILTPNRLKLGRNNLRSIHMQSKIEDTLLPSELIDQNRKLMETFYTLLTERVHQIMLRPNKWNHDDDRLPKVDDVVLFVLNDGDVGKQWKLGRIIEVFPRSVKIMHTKRKQPNDIPSIKFLTRSIRDVSIILSENEVPLNSEEYRQILISKV